MHKGLTKSWSEWPKGDSAAVEPVKRAVPVWYTSLALESRQGFVYIAVVDIICEDLYCIGCAAF